MAQDIETLSLKNHLKENENEKHIIEDVSIKNQVSIGSEHIVSKKS